MLEINNYQILDKIYHGCNSMIFRGKALNDKNRSVIIKVPSAGNQGSDKLRNEWAMRLQVNSDYVVRYLALEPHEIYGSILIEEDDQAETLANFIPKTGFELGIFLNIVLQITQGLYDIHQSNIVHSDIKPGNLIYQSKSGKVKFIDFGSASPLHQIKPVVRRLAVSGGTFMYLSPEQTGRTNRLLDYRTDFYSLGVTFYELICGKLPFTAGNLLQLIHSHIAKLPTPPCVVKPSIPPPLSEIIMKLMNKNAEDRYQSVHGLLIDLKKCADDINTKGKIIPFVLGQQDFPERFNIPQKLYGREAEFKQILQAYDRLGNPECKPEVIMITGNAGLGKSVLVNEIQPTVTAKKGYFLSGKFERTNINLAYSAISQAFESWVEQILLECNEDVITLWKSKLLSAIGSNGQVLLDIIPSLEGIIGKQSPVCDLDTIQSKNRFHLVFQNFISVIARPEHPVVLCLDDWQYADLASLNLIEAFMTNPTTHNVLIIGAFRDSEVDVLHPFKQTLSTIKRADVSVQFIPLSPLSQFCVNQLVSETLHCTPEATSPLANVLYKKTEGNPFYIRIFLQVMYSQDLLILGKEGWQWNLNAIHRLPATDNVIDFMVHQIQQLPSNTRAVLKVASSLGCHFTLDILIKLIELTEHPKTELQSLVDGGFILQLEDGYQFIHDHVRETAYNLISLEERAPLHLTIGRLLQSKLPIAPSSEQLFEVLRHLNQGERCIVNQAERLMLATLNFDAGKAAKSATAYKESMNFLQIAARVLGTIDGWEQHYDLTFSIYKQLAEFEYLNGNFLPAENLIQLLLSHAKSTLSRCEVYSLVIVQKTMVSQYQESIALGYKALELLGVQLPKENLQKAFEEGQKEILSHLSRLAIKNLDELLNMPLMSIPELKLALKILDSMIPATYCINSELHPVIVTMMINLSLVNGYTPEVCSAYSLYAQILCSKLNDYKAGYDFGQLAIKLSDKLNDPIAKCRACSLFVPFTLHWSKHLSESDSIIEAGRQAGFSAGDFLHLGYLCSTKARILFHQGVPLNKLASQLIELLEFPQKTRNQVAMQQIRCMQIIVANLLDNSSQENLTEFSFEGIKDSECLQNWQQQQDFLTMAHYAILKAFVLYLYNYLEAAHEEVLRAKKLLNFCRGEIEIVIYCYVDSLILAALYPLVSLDLQQQYAKQLESNQAQMKCWADHCPENFQHKYLLVTAEIERIQGKDWEAADHYDQAFLAAQQHGYLQDQALACELGAKFWLSKQKPRCAQTHINDAYHYYSQWGAKRKMALLMSQYPALLTATFGSRLSSFPISSDATIKASSLALIDLTSVVRVSQTISSEIELSKLLFHMMQIIIENAGAQIGSFWLEEDSNMFLQAECNSVGQIQTLQRLPLTNWDKGPRSLIEYVKRTLQTVLLGDAEHDKQFSKDSYIRTHAVKSVMCLPLMRQKKLKGILYLENNLLPHAFTEQHQQILSILASQITISLENALLYESMRLITERFNLALQSSNVGTWSWNVKDNKISWCENMYALFGVKKEAFAHTLEGFLALVHPDDRTNLQQTLFRTLAEDVPYNLEYRIVNPSTGSIHYVLGNGKVSKDAEGNVERVIGIVLEITERKRLEEERLAALKQAEERERQRAQDAEKHRREQEESTDTAYHEMRNPLSGIYGCVDEQKEVLTVMGAYLQNHSDEKLIAWVNKIKKNVATIELCAKHQKNIIEGSLSLSKIESGKTTFTHNLFQPGILIEEALQIYATQITKKQLHIQCSFPEQAVVVKGDADKFKSIIINLISNAIKYTESGYIKVGFQACYLTPGKCGLTLYVEDTGKGISRELQKSLYKRFSRTRSSQFSESIGLGLAITKEIIDLLGGTIEMESEEGKGTKFTVHLAFDFVSPEEAIKPSSPLPTEPLPRVLPTVSKNILIVEDNIVNQKILKRIIEQAGYQCAVANNGLEALAKYEQSNFDIIFMDIEMPEMDGIQATKMIRQREKGLGGVATPIVGLSAYAREKFSNEAQSAGMNAYITKPYEKKEIYKTIDKYLTLNLPESVSQQSQTMCALPSAADKSHASSPLFFQPLTQTKPQDNSQVITRRAIGQLLGKDIVFEVFQTKADVNTGFYNLPIPYDRAGVVTLLLHNLDNNRIRVLIANEIIENLKSNHLPEDFYCHFPPLKEIRSYLENSETAKAELLKRAIDAIDPSMTYIKNRQVDLVIKYLQQKSGRTNIEDAFLVQLQRFQEETQAKFNEFKTFCQSKALITAFIQDYVGKQGRLCYTLGGLSFNREISMLDAILECAQPPTRLIIWEDDVNDAARINIVYEGGDLAGIVTHVYHQFGKESSFELMAETTRPLYSLLPSAPSVEQRTTAQALAISASNTEKRTPDVEEKSATDQERHEDKKLAQASVAQGIFTSPSSTVQLTARETRRENQPMDIDKQDPSSKGPTNLS